MSLRLRSDFWVAALLRRAEAAGAYVTIARRGAAEAGAIFVAVHRQGDQCDLYGPAPQSVFDVEHPSERLFLKAADGVTAAELRERIDREIRFDPDVWLVDIEDRDGRPFVELVSESAGAGFTDR